MSLYYPGMEFELPEELEAAVPNQEKPSLVAVRARPRGDHMPVTKIDDFQSFSEEINSTENVLVKFEADWCMPCKAMASVVEEVAKQHPDVKVLAVDIDGEGMEEAIKKFGVRSVPTFVRVRQGDSVRSTCGTVSKAELASLLSDEN